MSNHPTFDDAVRRKAAGYEMQPEAYVLENIFSHEAMQSRRRTRRRFFFLLFFFLSGTSLTTMAVVLSMQWLKKAEPVVAAESQITWLSATFMSDLMSEEIEAIEPSEIISSFPSTGLNAVGAFDPVVVSNDESETTKTEATSDSKPKRLSALKSQVLSMQPVLVGSDAAELPSPVWEVVTVEEPRNEFHLGTHVTFNRTALINDDYFSRHEGYSLRLQTDFGAGYGVTVGYDFRRTIGIQVGITIHSMEGQRYEGNIGGDYVSSEVLLRYIHIPVFVKLKHEVSNSDIPIVLNVLIGGQFGKIKAAEVVVNNIFPGKDVVELFKENVAGVAAGLDADFYLNQNLYVTLGLRGSLSGDISGTKLAVKNDNQPIKSLLTGVTFGLNFALTR